MERTLEAIADDYPDLAVEVAAEFAGAVESRRPYTTEPGANLIERLDHVREAFDVTAGWSPNREAGHDRLVVRDEDGDAVDRAADWLRDAVDTVES